jgi:glycine/D-amino acid oxidase-like deaminating enzyme
MGAWTALHAVRSGRGVTLIDAWGAGHPRATSGDETRIIRSGHADDAFYTRWSREARAQWQAFGEATGERIFVQAGCLWFAHADDGFEAASAALFDTLGIPYEALAPEDVTERWPGIRADDLVGAIFEPEAGLLMARRGVAAVAAQAARQGAAFELAAVRPGRIAGDRLLEVVDGAGQAWNADAFVFAAGPWLPRLFPDLLDPLIRVTKQDVVFMGPRGGDDRWGAEAMPCWIDFDAAFYGIPGVDGRGFKLAPDRYGPVFDPSAGERIVDAESVRLARAYLASRFPDLATQPVVETRVCQYERTPDGHFLIDRHPDLANVWIAGGGSGHGFKHGPVIGRHVVERLDGAPGPADGRFALDRPRTQENGPRTSGDDVVRSWRGY